MDIKSTTPLSGLFRTSPFKPVQAHMRMVFSCICYLPPLLDALYRKDYEQLLKGLSEDEKELLKSKNHFYVVDFRNIDGLVMPIILKVIYKGGQEQEFRIPAEIWRRNNQHVSKLLITQKEIESLVLDPHQETADVDMENNFFPRRPVKSRFQLFKMQNNDKNDMQRYKGNLEDD